MENHTNTFFDPAQERQRIIDDTLRALPVGNVRTHTEDTIPERVSDLVKALAEAEAKADGLESLLDISRKGAMFLYDECKRFESLAEGYRDALEICRNVVFIENEHRDPRDNFYGYALDAADEALAKGVPRG